MSDFEAEDGLAIDCTAVLCEPDQLAVQPHRRACRPRSLSVSLDNRAASMLNPGPFKMWRHEEAKGIEPRPRTRLDKHPPETAVVHQTCI